MKKHPHLVAEYNQIDDSRPFEPLQLHCAVMDLERVESMHGKLTVIVRCWLRYDRDGKGVLLSFNLGDSVTVNSIVDIPTIKAWKSIFDFNANIKVAKRFKTTFPLIYEATKHGLPVDTIFSDGHFVRPIQGSPRNALSLLTNIDNKEDIKLIDDYSSVGPLSQEYAVIQTTLGG